MSRLLIVNADDYGISPGVSEGILRAAETGIVSSTTVMANLVTGEELRNLQQSGLPCGCHLNLSLGPPTDKFPPELLDERGRFSKQLSLNAATWEDSRAIDAAEEEWITQIVYLRGAGMQLTHLDSHHHVHMLEPLFPIALHLARAFDLGLRVRSGQLADACASGVRCPGEFVEGYFGNNNIGSEDLLALAATKADTVEVMCHPGVADDTLSARSGYVSERERELEVLADPGLKSRVEEMGWRLGGYADLAQTNADAT